MPQFYCDYCDKFLKVDSEGARRQHNYGQDHRKNYAHYWAEIAMDPSRGEKAMAVAAARFGGKSLVESLPREAGASSSSSSAAAAASSSSFPPSSSAAPPSFSSGAPTSAAAAAHAAAMAALASGPPMAASAYTGGHMMGFTPAANPASAMGSFGSAPPPSSNQ